MARIDLQRVTVRSGSTSRLSEVTLSVDDGSFVGVVGGSGSGKTSLLRAIAGLDPVDHGRVLLGGRDVTGASPGERDVGMVFQAPALMGHLSARRNVAFPLEIRRLDTDDVNRRVDAEMRALHIERLVDRDSSTLSAGEQQMVQIARALVRVPTVLLLDEPFASLDEHLRRRMRAEIAMLQSGYGVTTLMATNDSADVQALASTLVVLDQGRLVQWGPTDDVRRTPATLLAAAVTGLVSLLDVTVLAEQDGFWLVREDPSGGEFVRIRAWLPTLRAHVGRTVSMAVRPEDVLVSATGSVPARVERALPLHAGGIQCSIAGVPVTVTAPAGTKIASGDSVRLRIDHYVLFDPATDEAIRPDA
jgi:ABC-type sugar transport system ATPase subunit